MKNPASRIRNFNSKMEYRRFGKTDQHISAITLGGMRFKHNWELPRDEIPTDMIEQAVEVTQAALESGINHIETAYGYRKSEYNYGIVLNDQLKIPRDRYHLMTKGDAVGYDDMLRMIDEQLTGLKTDYFDFYAWHGVNNFDLYQKAFGLGEYSGSGRSAIDALLELKEQGVIRSVGFSTHADLRTIHAALGTEVFDFFNLHYYYFFQRNLGAVNHARELDMGVFIISPNDKGGHLFNPSSIVKNACKPATPIQWNARFCLAHPGIHTLSFGMTELAHIDEMKGIFPTSVPMSMDDRKILSTLDTIALDSYEAGYDGFELMHDSSTINIPEVLRYNKLRKCFGMKDFGRYRYNMHSVDDHWVPGSKALPELVQQLDDNMYANTVKPNIDVQGILTDTHNALYVVPESSE